MGVLNKLNELGEELKESTGYSPTTRPQNKAADEADDDLDFEEEEVPELEGEPLSGDEAPEATTVTPSSLNRGGFEPVPGPRSDERLEVALAEAEQAKQALADAEQAKAEAEAEATQAKQAQDASKAKARDLEFQLDDAKAEAERAKQAQADAEVESENLDQRVKELERQIETLEAQGARPLVLRDSDGKISGLTDHEIVSLVASPQFIGELDAHARGCDAPISPEMLTAARFFDIIIEEQRQRDQVKAEAEAQREADAARARQLFNELNELLKKSGCTLPI